MKIMYITFDDLKRNFAWSVHTKEVVKSLGKLGYNVEICSGMLEGRFKIWRVLSYLFFSFFFILKKGVRFKPDAIYCRGAHFSLTPIFAGWILGKPFVLEINGLLEDELKCSLLKKVFGIIQRVYLGVARKIITVSERLKEGLIARYGVYPEKIVVIPNGADCEKFKPMSQTSCRERLKLPAGKSIILYAGSFYPHHGLEILIESANLIDKERKGCMFLLVGDGLIRKEIEKEVLQRNITHLVKFTGEVEHSLIPFYIGASDICVYILRSPYSKYFGFSPIKLYEYIAGERPVAVLSNLDEIIALVKENNIGLAEKIDGDKENPAKKLTDMIIRLLEDRKLSRECGENGRRLALERFNWDRTAEKLDSVLRRLI